MTDSRDRQRRSWSNDAVVAAYERGRPGYPDDAVDWLVGDARRVLELGAGSGKLTRSLVARGLDVVAVEPLDRMRSRLAEAVPGADVRAGTAEAIPAGAGEFDLVLAAQAWHWFDPEATPREVARVLRPGGALGLVWNIRDTRDRPWVAELERMLRAVKGATVERPPRDSEKAVNRLPEPFERTDAAEFGFEQVLDADGVVAAVSSRSYVITMPAAERARLLDRVRALVAKHQTAAGTVMLPYVTECYRAVRR